MCLFKHSTLSTIVLCPFLAVGIIGNTSAAPGNGKGPLASIDVTNTCTLDASDPSNAILTVDTSIADATDEDGPAPVFASKIVQAQEKVRRWSNLGDAIVTTPDDNPVVINLCQAGLDPAATAINASVTVEVLNSNKVFYSSGCDDNPDTDIDESSIDIGHLGLCP